MIKSVKIIGIEEDVNINFLIVIEKQFIYFTSFFEER